MLIEQIPTSAIEMADLPIITPPRVTRADCPDKQNHLSGAH